MGVDIVVSTITGNAQLRLIEDAVACRVRRFVPAEFEGRPGLRMQNDPLDRGRAAALALLQHYRGYIQSTVFVCGILYERFAVNGLMSHGMGTGSGLAENGAYIIDARSMSARVPLYGHAGNLASICMTSMYDVGRFVVRALNMAQWPAEMTMSGDRMSVAALVETVKRIRGTFSVWALVAWCLYLRHVDV